MHTISSSVPLVIAHKLREIPHIPYPPLCHSTCAFFSPMLRNVLAVLAAALLVSIHFFLRLPGNVLPWMIVYFGNLPLMSKKGGMLSRLVVFIASWSSMTAYLFARSDNLILSQGWATNVWILVCSSLAIMSPSYIPLLARLNEGLWAIGQRGQFRPGAFDEELALFVSSTGITGMVLCSMSYSRDSGRRCDDPAGSAARK